MVFDGIWCILVVACVMATVEGAIGIKTHQIPSITTNYHQLAPKPIRKRPYLGFVWKYAGVSISQLFQLLMGFDGNWWYLAVLGGSWWYLMVFDGIRWYLVIFDGSLCLADCRRRYSHQNASNAINHRQLVSKPISKCPTLDLVGSVRGPQLYNYVNYWWVLMVIDGSWWYLMHFGGC